MIDKALSSLAYRASDDCADGEKAKALLAKYNKRFFDYHVMSTIRNDKHQGSHFTVNLGNGRTINLWHFPDASDKPAWRSFLRKHPFGFFSIFRAVIYGSVAVGVAVFLLFIVLAD